MLTTDPQGTDVSSGHLPSRGEEVIGYVERGLIHWPVHR